MGLEEDFLYILHVCLWKKKARVLEFPTMFRCHCNKFSLLFSNALNSLYSSILDIPIAKIIKIQIYFRAIRSSGGMKMKQCPSIIRMESTNNCWKCNMKI